MNRLPQQSSVQPRIARWAFGAAASLVGLFLIVVYVRLLQDSVARGAQWRYSQMTAESVAEVAGPAPIRLVSAAR